MKTHIEKYQDALKVDKEYEKELKCKVEKLEKTIINFAKNFTVDKKTLENELIRLNKKLAETVRESVCDTRELEKKIFDNKKNFEIEKAKFFSTNKNEVEKLKIIFDNNNNFDIQRPKIYNASTPVTWRYLDNTPFPNNNIKDEN